MAFFAEIDDANIVIRVIETDSPSPGNTLPDFILRYFPSGKWVQTFSDGAARANYAGPGHIYDPENDVFIPVKPQAVPEAGVVDHVLDKETFKWIPINADSRPTTFDVAAAESIAVTHNL